MAVWIPVDESLPSDRRDVGFAKTIAKRSRLGYDSTDMVPRVTHWQRLPSLPDEVTP